MPARKYVEQLFLRTLARVDVARTLSAQVSYDQGWLRVAHLRYRLEQYRSIAIVAAGKASVPMVDAVVKVLLPRLDGTQRLEGIVVSATQADNRLANFRYFVGGHPTPDEESRRAADAVLSFLAQSGDSRLVFFLISGGASAMIEKPLDPRVSVEDTGSFYRSLVHSGLPITQMNTLRKHFSAVKGGRLAQAADGATQCTLIVSDVPEGSLDMVGSGPSMPDNSSIEECRRILAGSHILDRLPSSVSSLLLAPNLPETVKPHAAAFTNASYVCLLSNAELLRETASLASADGYHVETDNTSDDWGYEEAGAYLLDKIRFLSARHRKVCLLSGGEISVRLPAVMGTGGRNQQFALWCALRLEQTRDMVTLLSAGTDGIDGNSPAAGAVVDSATCRQARRTGLDPAAFLERFDSFTFFSKLGTALITGPTGNNMRDLRILLCG